METHIENWKEKLAGMIVVWAKDDLIRTPVHPVLESFIESLISQEREDMRRSIINVVNTFHTTQEKKSDGSSIDEPKISKIDLLQAIKELK